MSQNKEGLKISYHLEAYLKHVMEHLKKLFYFLHITKHKFLRPKNVLIRSAYKKTDNMENPFYTKMSYNNRKKSCIIKALEILEQRHDTDTIWKLERSQKKDDMCDVICQLQAINGYIYLKNKRYSTK